MNGTRAPFIFMGQRKEFIRSVKIAGMLAFVPLLLAGGVVAGYMAGTAMVRYLHWPRAAVAASIAIGLASSIIEVYRIIRVVRRIDRGAPGEGRQ